jgi:di/tricarboxylate transporter
MFVFGQRMIPERTTPQELTDTFDLRPYLAELRIPSSSTLAGKTLAQSGLGHDLDLTVLAILRDGQRQLAPSAGTQLQPGDALLVEGSSEQILKIKDFAGIDIQADAAFSDFDLQDENLHLAEVVLLPRSIFIGRTLKGLQVREKYKIQVLAISRKSGVIHSKIAHTRLNMGDVLLVQGGQQQIAALKAENLFDVLGTVEARRIDFQRAWIVLGIFSCAFFLATFEIIPLPVAMLSGAFLTFLTRCITPEEAYRQVEWKVLILIGSMLALGVAMQTTGTALFLAEQLVKLVGHLSPTWLLSGFFILAVFLTQPMSNQAAAAVIIPIAIQTAIQLDLNPRTFAMIITVAASTSYLTPLEPACLMVYGPGRYRFVDFLKVGGLLTLIIYFVAIGLVPIIWPLH